MENIVNSVPVPVLLAVILAAAIGVVSLALRKPTPKNHQRNKTERTREGTTITFTNDKDP
jgi:hypothetical protein